MTALFRSGSRLEAFSDGVFAIAVTLLILEVRVPPADQAGTPALLWHALLARWPSYFALVLSFWTILVAWIGHHMLFQEVRSVSRSLAWVNGLFLLLVTVIPFTTALVAEHLTHPSGTVAAAIYAGANVLNSLAYLLLTRVAHLQTPEGREAERYVAVNAVIVLVLSVVAVGLAFLSPLWSLLLVALTWLWWALPPWPSWRLRR